MFLKEVSYAHQSCIYFIKTYSKTVILWNIITIQTVVIESWLASTFV